MQLNWSIGSAQSIESLFWDWQAWNYANTWHERLACEIRFAINMLGASGDDSGIMLKSVLKRIYENEEACNLFLTACFSVQVAGCDGGELLKDTFDAMKSMGFSTINIESLLHIVSCVHSEFTNTEDAKNNLPPAHLLDSRNAEVRAAPAG